MIKRKSTRFATLGVGVLALAGFTCPVAHGDIIAFDNFETGNYSGGTGWAASSWSVTSGSSVGNAANSTPGGSFSSVTASGSNRGISRTVDLTGASDVTLDFMYAHRFLEANENEQLRIDYNDGDTTTTLDTITLGASGNPLVGFFPASYSLDTSSLTGTTQTITFRTVGFGGTDFVYLDDIAINGTIPEPASLALLGAGGLLMLSRRRSEA